jgi:hypothetical protein
MTFPDCDDISKKPKKEVKCSRCGLDAHRKSTCMKPQGFTDIWLVFPV